MAIWQLKINDPSGEIRYFGIKGAITIGKASESTILLKDPTAPIDPITLWPCSSEENESPFWIKVSPSSTPLYLGDLAIREAHFFTGLPLYIGETKITLEKLNKHNTQPSFPSGVRPWLCTTEEGHRILWMAKKAAMTSLAIYLAGETGTGKEVLSQLIHAWSERRSGPFIPLHCGALPLSLAESELFGHVKGAFTGAVQHRTGALMQAHNGTLFLDEVGDLPLDIQVKLLRFLENGEIRPVGADRVSKADVRLICATHHPLEKLVETGKFRQDLYYRLASVTLTISPIRNRIDDIELLALKYSEELKHPLSPKALLRLKAYPWPGNVRELRHAIERASGLSGAFSPILNEEDFEFLLTPQTFTEKSSHEMGSSILTLHEMERVLLLKSLKLTHGNRSEAAKILGVARSTLFEMLKRHHIQGPKYGKSPS